MARSGTQWTDEDYAAAGYGRITLRLPIEVLSDLDDLAERGETSRARVVSALVSSARKNPWQIDRLRKGRKSD